MSEYYGVVPSKSFSHHGIKNQKWGVRRFQNEDGTLTEAGLIRYRKKYDEIKRTQILSDNDNITYNKKYYNRKVDSKLKLLNNRVGNVGMKQIENSIRKSIMDEGKRKAEDAKNNAIKTNKSIDKTNEELVRKYGKKAVEKIIRSNELFKIDPEATYNNTYAKYTSDDVINKRIIHK